MCKWFIFDGSRGSPCSCHSFMILSASLVSFVITALLPAQLAFVHRSSSTSSQLSASVFRSATVCKSLTCMRDDLTLMSTWHGVMADKEKFMRWKISTHTVYNTLKTDTKYSHSVHSRPLLKDEECFQNRLVHENLMRDLFMSPHFWVSLSSRNTMYQLSYLMLIMRGIN